MSADGNVSAAANGLGAVEVTFGAKKTSVAVSANGFAFPPLSSFDTFKGSYRALLAGSPPSQATAGLVTLSLTKNGSFSGSLKIDGKSYAISGKLSADGTFTGAIKKSPFTVTLSLDLNSANAQLTGMLTGGAQPLSFTADRAFFSTKNPFVSAVQHCTFLIAPPADTSLPKGQGFGFLTAMPSGALRLIAKLGDGTPITFGSAVSRGQSWPLYLPLYRGEGSISGFVNFADLADSALSATLQWFKSDTAGPIHPSAFATSVNLAGSKYRKPQADERIVTPGVDGDGKLSFEGGDLTTAFSIDVNVSPTNRLTSDPADTHQLKSSLTLGTGAFAGSFLPDGATARRSFIGAVFQKTNRGAGLLIGSDATGSVTLEAR